MLCRYKLSRDYETIALHESQLHSGDVLEFSGPAATIECKERDDATMSHMTRC